MVVFTRILLFSLQNLCSPSKLLLRDLKLGLKEAVPGEESLTDRERGVRDFSLGSAAEQLYGRGDKSYLVALAQSFLTGKIRQTRSLLKSFWFPFQTFMGKNPELIVRECSEIRIK